MNHVWLIEDNHHGPTPNWFAGWLSGHTAMLWTNDARKAVWFVRKEDAAAVMNNSELADWGFVVLQHAFEAEPPASGEEESRG